MGRGGGLVIRRSCVSERYSGSYSMVSANIKKLCDINGREHCKTVQT